MFEKALIANAFSGIYQMAYEGHSMFQHQLLCLFMRRVPYSWNYKFAGATNLFNNPVHLLQAAVFVMLALYNKSGAFYPG